MPPPYKKTSMSAGSSGGKQPDEDGLYPPVGAFVPEGFDPFGLVPGLAPGFATQHLNFEPFHNHQAFAQNSYHPVAGNFAGEFPAPIAPAHSAFTPPVMDFAATNANPQSIPSTAQAPHNMSNLSPSSKAAMKVQLDSRAAELREQLLRRRKEGTPDSANFTPHSVPKFTAAQPNAPANDNDIAALIADISGAIPEPIVSGSSNQASHGQEQDARTSTKSQQPSGWKNTQRKAQGNSELAADKKIDLPRVGPASSQPVANGRPPGGPREEPQANAQYNSGNSKAFSGSKTLTKNGPSRETSLPPKLPNVSRHAALPPRPAAAAPSPDATDDVETTKKTPRSAEETNSGPREIRHAPVGIKNTTSSPNNAATPTLRSYGAATLNSSDKTRPRSRPTLQEADNEGRDTNLMEATTSEGLRGIAAHNQEVQEWLTVTGYYDLEHRHGVLARRRRIALIEAEREQLLGEEAAAFASRGYAFKAPPPPTKGTTATQSPTLSAPTQPPPPPIETPTAPTPGPTNTPKANQPTLPAKREYEEDDHETLPAEKIRRVEERSDGPRPRTSDSASQRGRRREYSPYRPRGLGSPDRGLSRQNSPMRYDNQRRREWSPDRRRYDPSPGAPRPHYFESGGYPTHRYDDSRERGTQDGRGGQGYGAPSRGRGRQPSFAVRKAKQVDLGRTGGQSYQSFRPV